MIYFLEDDPSIRKLVIYTLGSQGMDAKGFETPSLFWSAMDCLLPDLILLDIMLPEEDGLHILMRLRSHPVTQHLPVLMLTAKGTEYDKVIALDAGADDYITKPFGLMELVARIKTALRHHKQPDNVTSHQMGCLFVDLTGHVVQVEGEPITLTLKEFQLLTLLLQRAGAVLTRDQILNIIWGYEFDGASRTVDVHIRTLRQKIGVAGAYIETIRGIGYKIGNN